jgi:hypothetical protein
MKIDEKFTLALENHKESWKYAWKLNKELEINTEISDLNLEQLLEGIKGKGDGHQREILKILLKSSFNERYLTPLFDLSLDIWLNIKKKSSLRITAYQILIKITNRYPSLKNELEILTNNSHLNSLSKGIKKSVYKLNQKNKIQFLN